MLYKNYITSMGTQGYPEFIKKLTCAQTKLVNDMKLWLGPWITLFSGKIKGKTGEEFEKKLFAEVEKFSKSMDGFTDDQNVLLNLVVRRIDLLDSDKIVQAAQNIARTKNEVNRLSEFLARLKGKTTFKEFEYYPCILVIDEIVDSMPWEMVFPNQEFARIHSIYMLLDLCNRFKDQIDNGYLKVTVKNGFAMINPDNDEKLGDMLKRMSQYYDDCLPTWQRVEGAVPQLSMICENLMRNDLFVYSGHGSSLQFFSDMEMEKIKHKCIMLLFGCESIAMKPRGTLCEATCSSYSFFKSGCPGMLGANTIVTDIWVDLITILILTQWITPKDTKHPQIGVCKDEHSKERVSKILRACEGKRNPNLLSVLCNIRNEQGISVRMRSAMIYRGLPPFNVACEK